VLAKVPNSEWLKANGGPLALVVVGLTLAGFTTAYAWVVVAVGGAWYLGRWLPLIPYRIVRIDGERDIAEEPAIGVYIPDPPCRIFGDGMGGQLKYCHLEVASLVDAPLERCHARLILLEYVENGQYVEHPYFIGTLRLKWAAVGPDHPEIEFRNVEPDRPELLDLVYTSSGNPKTTRVETLDKRNTAVVTELLPGNYRLTVRVSADGRPHAYFICLVMVTGSWPGAAVVSPYVGPPLPLRRATHSESSAA
jgi:hypothetical protein